MIKAGTLLVAHPSLPQRSLFSNSVILVTEQSAKGTAGLILNKSSEHRINDILTDSNLHQENNVKVYKGGPMNSQALIMLHSDEWYASNTMAIPGGYAVSSDTVMLEKMQGGNTPEFWRLMVGLAGWMPGQLEEEISQETWLTCEPEPSIIFEHTGKTQWRRAVDLCANQAVAQYF